MWGLGVTLLAPLPLMVAHYALGYGAIGQTPGAVIAMLCLDAVLTGFMGPVITISGAIVADHIAARAGAPLLLGGL